MFVATNTSSQIRLLIPPNNIHRYLYTAGDHRGDRASPELITLIMWIWPGLGSNQKQTWRKCCFTEIFRSTWRITRERNNKNCNRSILFQVESQPVIVRHELAGWVWLCLGVYLFNRASLCRWLGHFLPSLNYKKHWGETFENFGRTNPKLYLLVLFFHEVKICLFLCQQLGSIFSE